MSSSDREPCETGAPLRRDLEALTAEEHDVIVVGGGIFGIAVARDAALRGLSVALLEKDDFAGATSANSFRMVHGGIRYLQHGDLSRVRASCRERRSFLRIAPHLVHPLPIVVPTYGHGFRGKVVLGAGMKLYDLLTPDRNRGIELPSRRIPSTRLMSRSEALELFPELQPDSLTGAGVFADAQMHHPARLAISLLRSAAKAGARAANHVAVTDFLRRRDRIVGVRARDALDGRELEIRGRTVVNAAGPWAPDLLRSTLGVSLPRPLTFSRDVCFVLDRRPRNRFGLAVLAERADPEAVVSRGQRHLLLVPWRGRTVVGVWHRVHRGGPDAVPVEAGEVERLLDEFNAATESPDLDPDEVRLVNAGLVLAEDTDSDEADLSYGKRSRIVDHAAEHGIEGLITLVGVRFTTARAEAERVVDRIYRGHGREPPPCRTGVVPAHGGAQEGVANAPVDIRKVLDESPSGVVRSLARNYGSEHDGVLRYAREDPALMAPLGSTNVIGAEVVHAVRDEMARTLEDVVFRRTDLGITGPPGREALHEAARILARELDWTPDRRARELEQVTETFPHAPPVQAREPTP